MPELLSQEQIEKLNEYWYAANYLTVGQIYLKDNPLLELDLRRDPAHSAAQIEGRQSKRLAV